MFLRPIRGGEYTHRVFEAWWVFYFWKILAKSCVQIVTTRIHVHSQSFITYQNHLGIYLTRFLNENLFPFYNQQVICGKIAAHNPKVRARIAVGDCRVRPPKVLLTIPVIWIGSSRSY